MSARFLVARLATRSVVAVVLLGAASCLRAFGQAPVEPDFYRGRTISLIVGSGEGGGFDLSARLVAQFLGRYIPGNPNIVVQNMPGASGLRAAEYVYNVAPRDGSTIAITQPSIVLHKVLNASARFSPPEYTFLGRLGSFVTFSVVWHTAPVQTVGEAKSRELILGAVGPSGPGAMLPAALNQLAGTRITIVKGYKSASELGLAMERGEVHGSGSSSWEYVQSKGWIDRKLVRILFTIAQMRSPYAPDVPTVVELASDARGRNIMQLAASASEIGRTFIAPPGVPRERAGVLQRGFAEMLKDASFIAESRRRSLDVEPLSAEDIRKIVVDDMSMSADVVEGTRAIMEIEK
jgi:tripartite-type tricarboxylate transporter receptor subunit TctC